MTWGWFYLLQIWREGLNRGNTVPPLGVCYDSPGWYDCCEHWLDTDVAVQLPLTHHVQCLDLHVHHLSRYTGQKLAESLHNSHCHLPWKTNAINKKAIQYWLAQKKTACTMTWQTKPQRQFCQCHPVWEGLPQAGLDTCVFPCAWAVLSAEDTCCSLTLVGS